MKEILIFKEKKNADKIRQQQQQKSIKVRFYLRRYKQFVIVVVQLKRGKTTKLWIENENIFNLIDKYISNKYEKYFKWISIKCKRKTLSKTSSRSNENR